MQRRRWTARGIVQGVGFRPFIFRLATEEELVGRVRNDGVGVTLDLQGSAQSLDRFERRLRDELPPLSQLDSLDVVELPPEPNFTSFEIVKSKGSDALRVTLAPDSTVCAQCLAEMADRSDRRYRYPFITCTQCGPRYTITNALPYDRPNTTMAAFPMCADCEAEYTEPLSRRHHAQPIACQTCGPWIWLASAGADAAEDHPKAEDPAGPAGAARKLLRDGKLLAIKGLGGFHLAVNARDDAAVRRLRGRKHRRRKPLAIMVRDLDVARRVAVLSEADEALLTSPASPILLAPARSDSGLSSSLALGLDDLGLMLPYTPVHHLLFDDEPNIEPNLDLDALVMTSGNRPSEPITIDNAEALAELKADALLLHNRDIHVACDDSVLRTTLVGPIIVRRARGYVPRALDASFLPKRSVVALGAELKATVSTLCQGELQVGRHLGDLDNPRAEDAFRHEIERMLRFGRVNAEAVACDLHPDLTSTIVAREEFGELPLFQVQHHHAHLCAVMVEHGLQTNEQVVGIILDGLGYGGDGTIWGGEVLLGGYDGFERVAHLRPVPQPGGDAAARAPNRMATSLLLDSEWNGPDVAGFDTLIAPICRMRSVSPLTSSTGRLFDGVAALLGVAPEEQEFEGEAAMLLEAAADPTCEDAYPLPLVGPKLDTRSLIVEMLSDRSPIATRAARFHNGLADGLARAALEQGTSTVVLGGGSMVNRLLLARLVSRLRAEGVKTLWPTRLPPGDGGLSAGQAAVAAVWLEKGGPPCA